MSTENQASCENRNSHFTTIELMETSNDHGGSRNTAAQPVEDQPPQPPPPASATTSAGTEERNMSVVSLPLTTSEYLYFDANTFKQVKRLYEGMLMVAIAYSVTMIIMMIVLYKTLPQAMLEQQAIASKSSARNTIVGDAPPSGFKHSLLTFPALESIDGEGSDEERNINMKAYPNTFRARNMHESAMNYLDQMIAINFMSLILYSIAFHAAHRELPTLTLALTSTLAFTMMFSVVKLFVEGVHFPNNFMSLLLRISIVFVALVYLGQLRRKQQYVYNANTFWLTPNRFLNHPTLRSSHISTNQTAQLIREFIASTRANAASVDGTNNASNNNSNKTDEDSIREYLDQPPDYEEALRCPIPGRVQRPYDGKSLQSASSQVTLSAPPPSFEQLASLDIPGSSGRLHPLSVNEFESNINSNNNIPSSEDNGAHVDAHSSTAVIQVIRDCDASNALGNSQSSSHLTASQHHSLSQSLTSMDSATVLNVEEGEHNKNTRRTDGH